MLTITKTEDSLRYIFYTFQISQIVIGTSEDKWVGTQHITNLVKTGQYSSTAKKLTALGLAETKSIKLFPNDVTALVSIISFTLDCFQKDKIPADLKMQMDKGNFDQPFTFSDIKQFYTAHTNKLLGEIKTVFSENRSMLKAIDLLCK